MLLLILLIAIPVLLWIALRDQNEGTPEEMAANPELNTQIWEVHYKRLQVYKRSKYRGMGVHGIARHLHDTASGNRNYRH